MVSLQGLHLEDSQLAARAAVIIMQLVQARDGATGQAAEIALTPKEIETLQALLPQLEGKTALPEEPSSTPIPRLGRLDHRQARRMGRLPQITTSRTHYHAPRLAIAEGWTLRGGDV